MRIVVTRDTLYWMKTRGAPPDMYCGVPLLRYLQEDLSVYVPCCSEVRRYPEQRNTQLNVVIGLFNCMNLCNTIRQEKDGFQDKIEKQQLIQLVKRVGSSPVRRPERITS